MTFPVLSADGDDVRVFGFAVDSLNSELERIVSDFTRYGLDAVAGLREIDPLVPADIKPTLEITASIEEHGSVTLFRFDGYENLLGAHPNNLSFGRVFDSITGDEIRLAEVLDAADLDRLRPSATEAIIDVVGIEYADIEWIAEGLSEPDSYATWWPGSDGLHVIFADYAVAPHAAGTPEITIPWTEFVPADARRLGHPAEA